MMLIPTPFNPIPNQERRIMKAYKSKKGCRIKAKKMRSSASCKSNMLLTPTQFKKYHSTKTGKIVSLPFQHKHLVENMNHKGGFLPLIAAALAPIIGGVAGGLIEKEIAGSGIYHKKRGRRKMKKSEKKKKGSGMYLNPYMGRRYKK